MFKTLIQNNEMNRLTNDKLDQLETWAQGIRNEVRAIGATHRSYSSIVRNYVFECLDKDLRGWRANSLRPDDNSHMNMEEYLEALKMRSNTQNRLLVNQCHFTRKIFILEIS